MGRYICPVCGYNSFFVHVDKRKVVMYIECVRCCNHEDTLTWKKLIKKEKESKTLQEIMETPPEFEERPFNSDRYRKGGKVDGKRNKD